MWFTYNQEHEAYIAVSFYPGMCLFRASKKEKDGIHQRAIHICSKGVELGKTIAKDVLNSLGHGGGVSEFDSSTNELLHWYLTHRD